MCRERRKRPSHASCITLAFAPALSLRVQSNFVIQRHTLLLATVSCFLFALIEQVEEETCETWYVAATRIQFMQE